MSAVIDFYKEHKLQDDPLHKALDAAPNLHAQFPSLRQQMLSCCGAQAGKGGKVELVVIDNTRWDELAGEITSITGKLERLDRAVGELDKLFAEAKEAGFDIFRKTPAGIRAAEVQWRAQHRAPPADPSNPLSRDTGIPNPELVAFAERAEAIMAGL